MGDLIVTVIFIVGLVTLFPIIGGLLKFLAIAVGGIFALGAVVWVYIEIGNMLEEKLTELKAKLDNLLKSSDNSIK